MNLICNAPKSTTDFPQILSAKLSTHFHMSSDPITSAPAAGPANNFKWSEMKWNEAWRKNPCSVCERQCLRSSVFLFSFLARASPGAAAWPVTPLGKPGGASKSPRVRPWPQKASSSVALNGVSACAPKLLSKLRRSKRISFWIDTIDMI